MGVNTISDLEIIKNGFDFSYLLGILRDMLPILISFTLHELSHAVTAYRLGDDTAKRAGRITLNPLKHIDPIGMLMILTLGFGYAKPVPVNMYRLRKPKRDMVIVAFAGPGCNVLIAIVSMFLYGALYFPLKDSSAGKFVLDMMNASAYLNIGLAIFNMLPIPPLDGSSVFFALLNGKEFSNFVKYRQYSWIVLFVLMWTNVLGKPLWAAVRWCYTQLFPLAQWASNTVFTLFYK